MHLFLNNSIFQETYSRKKFFCWILQNFILWFWDQILEISYTQISVLNDFVSKIRVSEISCFHKNNLGSMEVKKCSKISKSLFLRVIHCWFYIEVFLNMNYFLIIQGFEDIGTRNLKVILIACRMWKMWFKSGKMFNPSNVSVSLI